MEFVKNDGNLKDFFGVRKRAATYGATIKTT